MIDALISDIQNPGKGTAGLLSHLREAEFTPSNSPDSFAAYLERISSSGARQFESGYGTQLRDMDSYQNRFEELSHRETDASARNTDAAAGRSGERTAKSTEAESVETERAEANGNTGESDAARARAEKSAEDASKQAAETKSAAADQADQADQAKKSDQKESQQGKHDKAVNDDVAQSRVKEAADEADDAAAGAGGVHESGEDRRADRAGVEGHGSKNIKKGGRTEQTEQSNVKLKQASDAAQKQPAADESELQAQQTAQEQAAQQKLVQEQTSQEKAAAARTRGGDAEGSKELSLQKGGDENRESLTGRELRNRRSEGRRAGEGEGRPKLTVVDRRSPSARSGSHNGNRSGAGFQNQSGNTDFSSALNGQNVNGGTKGESDGLQVMQVHLRADGTPAGSTAQAAGRSGDSGIRGQLLQQLQDHLNNDIVKRSSILIRENGSGEIKLDLKPDNLGQVRIRITMENNHIAGKIFVENSSVKEAFDQNMQQLYRAFKEHGFEDAALNVSVGDQGREQQERGRSHGPQPRVASKQIHSLNEQSARVNESNGELRLVDVMA